MLGHGRSSLRGLLPSGLHQVSRRGGGQAFGAPLDLGQLTAWGGPGSSCGGRALGPQAGQNSAPLIPDPSLCHGEDAERVCCSSKLGNQCLCVLFERGM